MVQKGTREAFPEYILIVRITFGRAFDFMAWKIPNLPILGDEDGVL